jgi:hypothetical protein
LKSTGQAIRELKMFNNARQKLLERGNAVKRIPRLLNNTTVDHLHRETGYSFTVKIHRTKIRNVPRFVIARRANRSTLCKAIPTAHLRTYAEESTAR